ncbi:hypothetical protein MUN78_14230 [Leucobacter allii]|uniref:Thyroglobulin type-1 domain-containing protein n=1 Tax=Leucobacter allii TaxID=2932247 RepID=A0ABY4FJW9_9MICO|nr:hypothetical protein [Leucobacter allii]UOQ56810.1 hypothetical protein MUN78_14230 [Leucobacter allii]
MERPARIRPLVTRTAIAALVACAALGLAGCGERPETAPTPTATADPQPEPETEVIELAPYDDDGALSEGWTLDESPLDGGAAPSDCRASEYGTGENTVSCGPTAAALPACWLTETATRIACLDVAAPEEQTLRLIPLDGPAPATTEPVEEPRPLWLELTDGSVYSAVSGGAFSPPAGYLVGYVLVSAGDGAAGDANADTPNELLVPDDGSHPLIDTDAALWNVVTGTDGAEGTSTAQVSRAWFLAGRELPAAGEDGGAGGGTAAEPTVEDANGRWCPTPESFGGGCLTVAAPTVSHETGGTSTIMSSWPQDGGLGIALEGAPLGVLLPAGVAAPDLTGYPGADLPDQDRIWNSQTGELLLRAD